MTSALVFDSKKRNRLGFLARQVADALAADPRIGRVRLAGSWEIGRALARERYDLILVFGGEELSPEIVQACRARAGRLVLWTTEDPYELDQILPLAAGFDCVFSNDAEAAKAYPNGAYLPFGYPDALCARLSGGRKRLDFVYVGKGWPNRLQALEGVLAASDGLACEIRVTDPVGTVADRPGLVVGPPLAYTSYLSLLAEARTCLIVGRDYSTNPGSNSRPRSVSPPPRFFECLGLATVPVVLGAPYEPKAKFQPARVVQCANPGDLRAAIRDALDTAPTPPKAAAEFALSSSVERLLAATFAAAAADA